MTPPFDDFLLCRIRGERSPFGNGVEVRLDLEQLVEHQRPRLRDGLPHREQANEVIADAEVVALRFDVGVHDLEVEILRGLRLAGDAPRIEVEQAAKEVELVVGPKHLDLHQVAELLLERLYTLL